MADEVWKDNGRDILRERRDGSFVLAEGVTEREALEFCVRVIQSLRARREYSQEFLDGFRRLRRAGDLIH